MTNRSGGSRANQAPQSMRMDTSVVMGGCHCGNLGVEAELPHPPDTYHPRACDCAFCRKHGAAYVSDPEGRLRIRVRDAARMNEYRQGSGQAEFIVCAQCGVLVAVVHRHDGRLFGTVNARALEDARFGEETPVAPRLLGDAERVARRRTLWFARVELTDDGAPTVTTPFQ